MQPTPFVRVLSPNHASKCGRPWLEMFILNGSHLLLWAPWGGVMMDLSHVHCICISCSQYQKVCLSWRKILPSQLSARNNVFLQSFQTMPDAFERPFIFSVDRTGHMSSTNLGLSCTRTICAMQTSWLGWWSTTSLTWSTWLPRPASDTPYRTHGPTYTPTSNVTWPSLRSSAKSRYELLSDYLNTCVLWTKRRGRWCE